MKQNSRSRHGSPRPPRLQVPFVPDPNSWESLSSCPFHGGTACSDYSGYRLPGAVGDALRSGAAFDWTRLQLVLERHRGQANMSYEAWREMPIGRNWLPVALAHLRRGRAFKRGVFPRAMSDAWSGADCPEVMLGRTWWLYYWREVGYTIAGRPTPLPARRLTLFRGANVTHRKGMSWTTDPEIAADFAQRRGGLDCRALVWSAEIAPWRLLAHIPVDRNEGEYVIDPRWLVPRPAE